jgi:hypothetical protein
MPSALADLEKEMKKAWLTDLAWLASLLLIVLAMIGLPGVKP